MTDFEPKQVSGSHGGAMYRAGRLHMRDSGQNWLNGAEQSREEKSDAFRQLSFR